VLNGDRTALGTGVRLADFVKGYADVHTSVHAVTLLAEGSCLADSHAWICGDYIKTYSGDIQHALFQHIILTATALGLALLLAIPLTALALWKHWLRAGIIGILGIVYTIPSLALFVLLQPVFGVTHATPVVIALVGYAQLLLIRNILVGLDGVPEESIDAARGLGYGSFDLYMKVRIPLALPAILAGLRVTTVSTIALLTVGGVINQGGLGTLLTDGFQRPLYAQILVALVLIVALAIVADLLLLLLQRALTPWTRARS
jgi:osmoprotectant transport system permease protein